MDYFDTLWYYWYFVILIVVISLFVKQVYKSTQRWTWHSLNFTGFLPLTGSLKNRSLTSCCQLLTVWKEYDPLRTLTFYFWYIHGTNIYSQKQKHIVSCTEIVKKHYLHGARGSGRILHCTVVNIPHCCNTGSNRSG